MNSDPEIRRLKDVMPASGRMFAKIIDQPAQPQVIQYDTPMPWGDRPIQINFDLWSRLSRPKRDLLILRAVGWLNASNWFKLELYQGIALVGTAGAIFQLVQSDAVGFVVAGGLSAIAGVQVWRNNHGLKVELAADEEAVRVAQRRGYSESEAAQHLLSAIQAVVSLENRPGLSFNELIRCQNLRTLAGLSPEGIPETLRDG
jgi:hypothetical protein